MHCFVRISFHWDMVKLDSAYSCNFMIYVGDFFLLGPCGDIESPGKGSMEKGEKQFQFAVLFAIALASTITEE